MGVTGLDWIVLVRSSLRHFLGTSSKSVKEYYWETFKVQAELKALTHFRLGLDFDRNILRGSQVGYEFTCLDSICILYVFYRTWT